MWREKAVKERSQGNMKGLHSDGLQEIAGDNCLPPVWPFLITVIPESLSLTHELPW